MDLQTTIKFVKGEGWDPQIVDPQGTNALTATTSDPLFWVCAVLLAVLAAGVAIYLLTKRRAARNALAGAGLASSSMHYNAVHARHAKPQSEKSNIFKKALIVIGALLLASTLAFAVSSRDSIKALANDAGFSLFGNTATTTNTNAEGVTVPETILGYVSADGKVTIDNAPITNNNNDFIEFYKSQLSEMKGVGNSTWKFTIQKADGTKVVLFEGKVGDAAQSTWARLDKGETGTLIVETDISPDLALQLIDNPTVKLGFNSMYHPVSLDITVSAGVKILDKDGNVLTTPIKVPSNEDFVFSIDDGQQGIATVVKVNGEVILPDEEGNYTIAEETIAKNPKVDITKYLVVLSKLNGGTIKSSSQAPEGWNQYTEAEGVYYKLYVAGPTAATIEAEWARDKVKVANEGNAFDGWNTNIPESGAVDNSYIEMKWAKSTKSFDPSEMTIDDGIIISDKDKLPYDEDDYPVPMKDGEDFTIHVNTDGPTKENDEIVVVISDESGSKEIVADPDGKVTIPDGDKDKDIKIKYKFAVIVDLAGGAIVNEPSLPTGWSPVTPAQATNQYTKKFLSGTSAEDIEDEWTLANSVHVKNGGQARDGWTTDITEKGLQKSGEKCTMTWLTAAESSTINIAPDKDGHVVITDTDGNEYVAGDFPVAVKKGDDFEYKVKINGETDDAKVKFVDGEGHEVTPDDEGVFSITGGDSPTEIKTTITYPAIVDLSGGSIDEKKLPADWTKVTEANGDKYQKYFDKGTPATRAAATDPAGVLDEWGTAIHKVKYENNAFKAWKDNIPATGIVAKTTELVIWKTSSKNFNPDADNVDDGITISDKDKYPYDPEEDYPIPMVDGEDFVIHVNPTDPEKTDEIVVVIGDDPGTEVTPGEGGKVTIKEEDKDKKIKIKYKYVVTVDLNGASILPAGGNPPTGWTKSEATSSNQYTKKFLSGTSAETVENEWSRANKAYVKFEGRARNTDNPWKTTIGTGEGKGQGLQADSSCTMQWLKAENSTTITFPTDMDENLIICDTDDNEYLRDEFPLAVPKNSEFEFKVKTKEGTETEDAKILVTDKDDKEIEPVDKVYKVAIQDDAVEVKGYITYPVIMDLKGGAISEADVPEGWDKLTETETEQYQKTYNKNTSILIPVNEWESKSEKIIPAEGKAYSKFTSSDDEINHKITIDTIYKTAQYSLTFNPNNTDYASIDSPAQPMTVEYGTTVTENQNILEVNGSNIAAYANTNDIAHEYTFVNWTANYTNEDGGQSTGTVTNFEPITRNTEFIANFSQSAKKYRVDFDPNGADTCTQPSGAGWSKDDEKGTWFKLYDYDTQAGNIYTELAKWTISKTGYDHNATTGYASDYETVGKDGNNLTITAQYTIQKYDLTFNLATYTEQPDRGVLSVDGTSCQTYTINNIEYGTPYTIESTENGSTITIGSASDEEDETYIISAKPLSIKNSLYSYTFDKWQVNGLDTYSGKVEKASTFTAFFNYDWKYFDVTVDFADPGYEVSMPSVPEGWEKVEPEQQNPNLFEQIANFFTGNNSNAESLKYKKAFKINTSIAGEILTEWENYKPTFDETKRYYDGFTYKVINPDELKEDTEVTPDWANAVHTLGVDYNKEYVEQVKDGKGNPVGESLDVKHRDSAVLYVKAKEGTSEEVRVFINGVAIDMNEDGYFVSDPITQDNSQIEITISYGVFFDLNGGICTNIPTSKNYNKVVDSSTYNGMYKTYKPAGTAIDTILQDWDTNTITKLPEESIEYKFNEWTIDPDPSTTEGKLKKATTFKAEYAESKSLSLNAPNSVTILDENDNNLNFPIKVFSNQENFKFKVNDSEGGKIKVEYLNEGVSKEEITPSEGVYTLTNEQILKEGQIIVTVSYKVTVDLNGGTGTTAEGWSSTGEAGKYEKYFVKDSTLSAALVEWGLVDKKVTLTGKHFTGWDNDDGTITKNTESQVKWDDNYYTVVFENQEGVAVDEAHSTMDTQNFKYNEEKKLSALEYQWTGHHFINWYTDKACTSETKYSDQQTVKDLVDVSTEESGSITLYAKWEANKYSIKFHENHTAGTATADQNDFTYGTAKPLSDNTWSHTGYTFLGWSKDQTATTATYTDKQEVTDVCTVNNGTEDLYAVWKTHTYTIKFEGNGATSGEMTDQTFKYDETKSLTKLAYTKTGHSFTKWLWEDSEKVKHEYDDEAVVSNLTSEDDATITMYAQWEANTYTITVYKNDGTGESTTQTVDYGNTYTLSEPTREGYNFNGYYRTAEGETAVASSGTYLWDSDIDVYAFWNIKMYFLTYGTNNAEYGHPHKVASSTDYDSDLTIPFGTRYYVESNGDLMIDEEGRLDVVHPICTASNDQYTYKFVCWYLSYDETETPITEEGSTITEDDKTQHFVAKFERTSTKHTAFLEVGSTETAEWSGSAEKAWTKTEGGYSKDFEYGTTIGLKENELLNGWKIKNDDTYGTIVPATGTFDRATTFKADYSDTTRSVGITSETPEMIVGSSTTGSQTLTATVNKGEKDVEYVWSVPSAYSSCVSFSTTSEQSTKITAEADSVSKVPITITVKSPAHAYVDTSATFELIVRNGTLNWNTPDEVLDKVYTVIDGVETEISSGTRIAAGTTIKLVDKVKKYYYNTYTISSGKTELESSYFWGETTFSFYAGCDQNITTGGGTDPFDYLAYANYPGADPESYPFGTYLGGSFWVSYTWTRTGYDFEGWYDNKECTGDQLKPNETTMTVDICDNITAEGGGVFCKWKPHTYTIKYSTDVGTAPADTAATYDVAYTAPNMTKEGYTFNGWDYVDPTTGETKHFNAGDTIKNITATDGEEVYFEAKWTPDVHTIKFDKNSDKATGEAMKDMEITYGEEAQALTANSFKRDGYTFSGWAKSPTGSKAYDDKEEVSNLVAGTTTLYAIWTPITFDIVYNGNGNTSGSMGTITYTYDDTLAKQVVTLEKNTYAKTNNKFTGWLGSDGITYADQAEFTMPTTSTTITMTAQWEATTYTVKFVPNAEDGFSQPDPMEDQVFKLGEKKCLSANTYIYNKDEDCKFLGWSTDISAESPTYTDKQEITSDLGAGDSTVTLYAVWQEKIDRNLKLSHTNADGTTKVVTSSGVSIVIQETYGVLVDYEGKNDEGKDMQVTSGTEGEGQLTVARTEYQLGFLGTTCGDGAYVEITIPATTNYKTAYIKVPILNIDKRQRLFEWGESSSVTAKLGEVFTKQYKIKNKSASETAEQPTIDISDKTAKGDSLFSFSKGATIEGQWNNDAFTITPSSTKAGNTTVSVHIAETDEFAAFDATYTWSIERGETDITFDSDTVRVKNGTPVTNFGYYYGGDGEISIKYLEDGSTSEKSMSQYVDVTHDSANKKLTITYKKQGSTKIVVKAADGEVYKATSNSFDVITSYNGTRTASFTDASGTAVDGIYLEQGETIKLKAITGDVISTDEYKFEASSSDISVTQTKATDPEATITANTADATATVTVTITDKSSPTFYKTCTNTIDVTISAYRIVDKSTTNSYDASTGTTSNAITATISEYIGSAVTTSQLKLPPEITHTNYDASAGTLKNVTYNINKIGDSSKAIFDSTHYAREVLFVVNSSSQFKVTTIADNAFKGCTNLDVMRVPKTVTSIGANAFNGCTSLKYFCIDGGSPTTYANNIGASAFDGCTSLRSFVLTTTSDGSLTCDSTAFDANDLPDYCIFAGGTKIKTIANNVGRRYYEVEIMTTTKSTLSSGKYYFVNNGITLSSAISVNGSKTSGDVVLDLNGKTLSRGLGSATNNGYVIKTMASKFRLDDTSSLLESNLGKVTGGYNNGYGGGVVVGDHVTDDNGTLVYQRADFIFMNGNICSNYAAQGGGVEIYVSNVDYQDNDPAKCENCMIMYGGYISDNHATNGQGGGIDTRGDGRRDVHDSAVIVMHGGTIKNNSATSEGGGICLYGGGEKHATFQDQDTVLGIMYLFKGTFSGNKGKSGSITCDVYLDAANNCTTGDYGNYAAGRLININSVTLTKVARYSDKDWGESEYYAYNKRYKRRKFYDRYHWYWACSNNKGYDGYNGTDRRPFPS